MTLQKAVESCAKLNMSLITAENATNVKSMVSKISGKIEFFNQKNLNKNISSALGATFDFWTSGANEGEFCDVEMVYSWCTSGVRVRRQDIAAKWVNLSKQPAPTERCLTFHTKDSDFGLDFSTCASKYSLVCEVRWHNICHEPFHCWKFNSL